LKNLTVYSDARCPLHSESTVADLKAGFAYRALIQIKRFQLDDAQKRKDCSVKGTSFAYDFSDSGYDGNRFLLARLQTCGDPELVVVGTKVERRQMHRL
jgi:hypothetical protein